MSRIAELQEARNRLNTQLAALRQPLLRLQDAEQKRRLRRPTQCPLWRGTHREVQYILCALEIVRWSFVDALAVVGQARSPPDWQGLDNATRVRVLEDLALRHDNDEVARWMDDNNPVNHARLKELWVRYSEFCTAKWVQTVNEEKGVAPSSLKVCQQYRKFLADAPAGLGLLALECDSLASQRNWAVRWRRRWGAGLGALPVGDVDPVVTLTQKADPAFPSI